MMKIPQNIQSEKNAHRIFQFSHKIARSGCRARHRKPRARVASDPAGPQPRAMKFGHRFQQVIEQTHPSVSDQVRSRAARHPSGMAGDKKLVTRRSSARHGARAVRAARRSRPSRVSRRARARARCRAATRSGASRRDTRPSAARLAAPYPPILVADQGKPPEPNASNPRTVESSRARFNVPFGRALVVVAPQFLCYKTLKKCLKSIPESAAEPSGAKTNLAGAAEPSGSAKTKPRARALAALTAEQRTFVKTLNDEIKKFNKFFMNAEEDLVMRERVLATRFHKLVDKESGKLFAATNVPPNGRPNVDAKDAKDARNGDEDDAKDEDASVALVSVSAACELRETRRAFADFHGELVLMEHWTSLNYTALVKILKKHDKRSSLRLRSPVLVSALQQPFYSTEVLTELIKKTEARFRVLHALASETEAAAREKSGKSGAREPEKHAAPSIHARNPAALARARAAISCWDGMKHEDSVKRPFGDMSALAEHPAPASKKVRA